MYYKTQGIILKRMDVGEADKILTVYSQDYGKIRCIAKGSRRPKSKFIGHLDILNLVNLSLVQGKSLDIVTGCETVASNMYIKKDIEYTAQVYLAIEFFEHVIHLNQKDEMLFDLLRTYLATCDDQVQASSHPLDTVRMLTWAFIVKCLNMIGVLPQTDRCVSCRRIFDKTDNILFTNSLFEGFWCATCEQKRNRRDLVRIDSAMVKVIRFLTRSLFSRVTKLEVDKKSFIQIDRVMRNMTNLNVQKKLISPGLIAELSGEFKSDIITSNID